ncbi:MAG: hypothetical protein NTZ09_20690, partial [Candidatus Hydrogenedentes bacterium]|nr:hypothetical protein [Candidatus Hydrogenedentota bacterium]
PTVTVYYNDNGNIAAMTDYHGNSTSYVYDDADRLEELTAPGGKTWIYVYNGVGQPWIVRLPNYMLKYIEFDERGRMSHSSYSTEWGGDIVESYDYTLDGNGNITAVDELNGAWDYTYDARQRLTAAVYTTALGHQAEYAYTYNDGDNLVTKQVPFEEDFDDGNYTAWGKSGTWSAANGYMRNDRYAGGSSYFYRSRSQADAEIRFSYLSEDTSSSSYNIRADLRHVTSGRVSVEFPPGTVKILEWDGSTWYTRAQANLTTQQNQWDLRLMLRTGNSWGSCPFLVVHYGYLIRSSREEP